MEKAWKQAQGGITTAGAKRRKSLKRKAGVAETKPKIKKEKKEVERCEPEIECNTLEGKTIWRNFKEACGSYKFPGSHQVSKIATYPPLVAFFFC
jgi:hypothetical protein